MARLAWIERRSEEMSNPILHHALKQMILEAVNAYEGSGKRWPWIMMVPRRRGPCS
jgi:hypothetical protein